MNLEALEDEDILSSITSIRESLPIAENLAQAALMMPSGAKGRLAARRIEFEEAAGDGYVPPRQLLLYLVRMGSFTSVPKILNEDTQDDNLQFANKMSRDELLVYCQKETAGTPSLIKRTFKRVNEVYENISNGVRVLQWNVLSKDCDEAVSSPYHIRVFQWNCLSQALGLMNDNFVSCPEEALEWKRRRFHILEEIINYCPDVICLQEVDHFNFLKKSLSTQGYEGIFYPKPDSPCIYLKGNNGPDGCAIFYRRDKFEMKEAKFRILEVWRVHSNQVAIAMILRLRETGEEVCVATTHLKARSGALLSTLRNEQGKDLLQFVASLSGERPVILCGDFNAEPTEPVYYTMLTHRDLALGSAYANNEEPPYTTWKVREEGEICHTIDYIFYSKEKFIVEAVLEFPTGDMIGEGRVPSLSYPSDHFSLVSDFRLKDIESER